MKSIMFTCILLCAVILFTGCNHAERSTDLQVVDTIPVTLYNLNEVGSSGEIGATGVFTTEDETLLSFKNGGVISRILVKEGDRIRKGQVLASVYAAEIDAKSNQVNLSIEKAKRDYERAEKLYLDSVATLEQFQNAKTALDVAMQDKKSVAFNQQYMQIVAPVNGYVLAKLANEGQVVGAGTPVLQVNGANDADWVLKVGVSDNEWMQIKVGDPATIQTDALSNKVLNASVYKKSEGLDPRSGTFAVYLKLKEKGVKLASGVFGKSIIQVDQRKEGNVWRIPYAAILDGNGKEAYVFITEDGKNAKKQKIGIAKIDNNYVVVNSGLEHVKSIIVSGSAYLIDGSPITIKPVSNF